MCRSALLHCETIEVGHNLSLSMKYYKRTVRYFFIMIGSCRIQKTVVPNCLSGRCGDIVRLAMGCKQSSVESCSLKAGMGLLRPVAIQLLYMC